MAHAMPFYTRLPYGDAFLGGRAQRLADLISQQGDELFRSAGIAVPVRCASTLLYLRQDGPSSLVQIAKALDESHQLTAKRMALLDTLSLVSCEDDPNDRRRRIFALTRKGKREARLVQARCELAQKIFEQLNRELAVQLGDALDAAWAALTEKSMLARSDPETTR